MLKRIGAFLDELEDFFTAHGFQLIMLLIWLATFAFAIIFIYTLFTKGH